MKSFPPAKSQWKFDYYLGARHAEEGTNVNSADGYILFEVFSELRSGSSCIHVIMFKPPEEENTQYDGKVTLK